MSQKEHVQLTSMHLGWTQLFSGGLQQLGAGVTPAPLATGLAVPTQQLGTGAVNPIGLIDNRKVSAMILLLAFGVQATNASQLGFDVYGYSKINVVTPTAPLWVPTKLFVGQAQGSAFALTNSLLGTGAIYGCDQFSAKTFAAGCSNVLYTEPADGTGLAYLALDIRGAELVTVRLFGGSGTAATYGTCFYAFN